MHFDLNQIESTIDFSRIRIFVTAPPALSARRPRRTGKIHIYTFRVHYSHQIKSNLKIKLLKWIHTFADFSP